MFEIKMKKLLIDSPQVAQGFVHGTRIPHPHFPDVNTGYYDSGRSSIPPTAEPPPAHRSIVGVAQNSSYAPLNIPSSSNVLTSAHMHPKLIIREHHLREMRKQQEREQHEREQRDRGQRERDRGLRDLRELEREQQQRGLEYREREPRDYERDHRDYEREQLERDQLERERQREREQREREHREREQREHQDLEQRDRERETERNVPLPRKFSFIFSIVMVV